MTSIRKQILVGSNPHFVEVNSSLDLEEVEITGTDPMTGKTVHISLSSLLRQPRYPEPSPYNPQPLGMGSPSPSYGSPSSPPGSLMDLNVPSPSSLSASSPSLSGLSHADQSAPYSPPAAMDMFSDPAPTGAGDRAPNFWGREEPLPTITPPLGSEVSIVPAPAQESGLQGLAGLSAPPLPPVPLSPLQEAIQAHELQGLEALDDPLPEISLSENSEVTVEPLRPLTPSLRKSDKEILDEHLDSMYRH